MLHSHRVRLQQPKHDKDPKVVGFNRINSWNSNAIHRHSLRFRITLRLSNFIPINLNKKLVFIYLLHNSNIARRDFFSFGLFSIFFQYNGSCIERLCYYFIFIKIPTFSCVGFLYFSSLQRLKSTFY